MPDVIPTLLYAVPLLIVLVMFGWQVRADRRDAARLRTTHVTATADDVESDPDDAPTPSRQL